jgi:hypothetical protein
MIGEDDDEKVTSCPFMGQLTTAFGERPVRATKSAANTETPRPHAGLM